jgi:hypothetical protein
LRYRQREVEIPTPGNVAALKEVGEFT